jgi:hypothetical protein
MSTRVIHCRLYLCAGCISFGASIFIVLITSDIVIAWMKVYRSKSCIRFIQSIESFHVLFEQYTPAVTIEVNDWEVHEIMVLEFRDPSRSEREKCTALNIMYDVAGVVRGAVDDVGVCVIAITWVSRDKFHHSVSKLITQRIKELRVCGEEFCVHDVEREIVETVVLAAITCIRIAPPLRPSASCTQ